MSETDLKSNVDELLEQHRIELTGYCYRMLGSPFEAEDAVQETMIRAWRGFSAFEGRAALRSWMYRIATNVCHDMLIGRQKRARPIDFGPSCSPDQPIPQPHAETTWVQPVPDHRVLPIEGDPAEMAVARETIRLAFIASLQHLPPKQRAVLILREVLSWSATEVAELLDLSVASVNSALQRARATLASVKARETDPLRPLDKDQAALLARYMDAFERYDLDQLTTVLHDDATLSMPPLSLWIMGSGDIRVWFEGQGIGCKGSKLVPVVANGGPAFAQYRASEDPHLFNAFSLMMLEIADGRIVSTNAYVNSAQLFPLFDLPLELRI